MFPRIWKVGSVSPKLLRKLVGRQVVDYIEFNQSLKQTIAEFRKVQSTTTVHYVSEMT